MKILIILLALFLAACGSTKMVYEADGSIEWSSKTLWKDVKDAQIKWKDLDATLGSSAGNSGEAEMMRSISCYLTPELCK